MADSAETQKRLDMARAAQQKRMKPSRKKARDAVTPAIVMCVVAVAAGSLLVFSGPKGFYEKDVNDAELIDHVNSNAKIWKARAQPTFEGWSGEAFRSLGMVSWKDQESGWHYCSKPQEPELPLAFDAREAWQDCFPNHVYEHGNCSASWAIAPVSALANRYCIQDQAQFKELTLSPQSVLSCDLSNEGCAGGGMDSVWSFLESDGVVSEACFPFTGDGVTCTDACTEEEPKKVAAKCVAQGEEAIKHEVGTNGPVVVPMRLTDELLVYESGVFAPTRTAMPYMDKAKRNRKLAMVKIIGWGTEHDTPYWTIENSWGAQWGEKGFARIAMVPVTEDSAQDEAIVLLTDFAFVGYPSNMKMPGKGEAEEFDDLLGDEDLELGDEDLTFDDDDSLDDDIFADDDVVADPDE